MHAVGEKVKKWVWAVFYSITSAAGVITHSGFDCLPVVGGVVWVFCNLLRDALVSGLEKSCFQLKGFSQIRLDRFCLIRWLSGFQDTTVVLMRLDSSRIPQRKCKNVFSDHLCTLKAFMNCNTRKHRLFYYLFTSYITSLAKYMLLWGKCLTDQTDVCVRFPSSPPAPSPLSEQKRGVYFVQLSGQ